MRSVERAFDLLELIQDSGGRTKLSDLSTETGLPPPTVHRLLGTLVQLGYVRQLPDKTYALGARLVRLGDGAGRQLGAGARPVLASLVDELGGDREPRRARCRPGAVHRAGALAALHADVHGGRAQGAGARDRCGQGHPRPAQRRRGRADHRAHGLPAATEHSISDPAALFSELARIRERGYAIDDGEQELGVRCYAVAVVMAPLPTAVSVSGPATRIDEQFGARAVRSCSVRPTASRPTCASARCARGRTRAVPGLVDRDERLEAVQRMPQRYVSGTRSTRGPLTGSRCRCLPRRRCTARAPDAVLEGEGDRLRAIAGIHPGPQQVAAVLRARLRGRTSRTRPRRPRW